MNGYGPEIFVCENPERDWINDLREAEAKRDQPPDEREDWTDPELWTEEEA